MLVNTPKEEPTSQPDVFNSKWMKFAFACLAIAGGAGVAAALAMFDNPLKLVLLFGGAGAAMVTMRNSEWGLLALVFMSYTRFSDVMVRNGAPSTAQPFLALLFLIIFLRWALYNQKPEPWLKPAAWIFVYGMVGVATFLYADDVLRVKNGVVAYFKDAIIVVVVVMMMRSPKMLHRAMWALLFAGIFMASITTWQQLTGTFENDYLGFAKAGKMQIVSGVEDDYRIAGPIGDPNFYSQVILTLIPLGMDRLWNEKNKKLRWFAIWQLSVCMASIFFSFSRGAFLSLAVSSFIMFVRRPPKPLSVIIIIALGFVVIPTLPASYIARLETIPEAIPGLAKEDVRNEASFRGRSSAQQAGLRMFWANPIFGLGVGNFGNHYQEYARDLGLDNSRWDQAPHNMYLEILTEKGLFGLSVFGAMIWMLFRDMNKARKKFREINMDDFDNLVFGFQAGLVGYMFAGIFLQLSYPRFFWILIAIAYAIPNVANKAYEEYREALPNGETA